MAIFGSNAAGGGEFPGSANRALISRFQCVGSGSIVSMTTWFGPSTASAINFKLVILSDAAGSPGSLLVVSAAGVSSGAGGGGPVTVAASGDVVDGAFYWLGIVGDNFPAYYSKDTAGADALMADGTFSFASPPSSWPGTDGTYPGVVNVSVTFNEGGPYTDEDSDSDAALVADADSDSDFAADLDSDSDARQIARPVSDVTPGAWTPSTGSDNFAVIDEAPASDADYTSTASNSLLRVGLAALSSPEAGEQTVSFRANGSPAKKLIVRLIEGASTVRGSTTVDPLPSGFTQYTFNPSGIVDFADLDLDFEVSAATSPPSNTATYNAIGAGTAATSTTSHTVNYPSMTGATPDTALYLIATGRSNTAGTEFAITGGGWTNIGTLEGGVGTWGADAGTRRVTVFRKDSVSGSESGTVTVTLAGTTANTLRASIVRVAPPAAGYTLSQSVVSGQDTSAGTAVSIAATSSLSYQVGDLMLIGHASPSDTGGVVNSPSLVATGSTFGSLTSRASVAITGGNDHRHVIYSAQVTAAGSDAAPTFAYTASGTSSGNASGPALFVRVRAVPPTTFARVSAASLTIPAAAPGDTYPDADSDSDAALLADAESDALVADALSDALVADAESDADATSDALAADAASDALADALSDELAADAASDALVADLASDALIADAESDSDAEALADALSDALAADAASDAAAADAQSDADALADALSDEAAADAASDALAADLASDALAADLDSDSDAAALADAHSDELAADLASDALVADAESDALAADAQSDADALADALSDQAAADAASDELAADLASDAGVAADADSDSDVAAASDALADLESDSDAGAAADAASDADALSDALAADAVSDGIVADLESDADALSDALAADASSDALAMDLDSDSDASALADALSDQLAADAASDAAMADAESDSDFAADIASDGLAADALSDELAADLASDELAADLSSDALAADLASDLAAAADADSDSDVAAALAADADSDSDAGALADAQSDALAADQDSDSDAQVLADLESDALAADAASDALDAAADADSDSDAGVAADAQSDSDAAAAADALSDEIASSGDSDSDAAVAADAQSDALAADADSDAAAADLASDALAADRESDYLSGINAAEIWGYVMANGKTAEENLLEIHAATMLLLTKETTAEHVAGGFSVGDILRILAAVAAGKTTITSLGAGSASVTFRSIDDAVDVVTATMSGSERVNVSIDPTETS